MRIREFAIWPVLAILIVIEIFGFATTRILEQEVWTAIGLRRLVWFSLAYGLWTIVSLRWLPQLSTLLPIGFFVAWAGLAFGPGPILAVVLFLLAAWQLGKVLLNQTDSGPLALLLGAAVYSFLQGFLAHVPVNYPVTALALLAVPLSLRPRMPSFLKSIRTADRSVQAAYLAVGFPPAAHLVTALKPEVSTDGLAMHLVIPSHIAVHHLWSFDFNEAFWAFMPMGADWCYTLVYLLAGEGAARLLNFAFLALLVCIVFSAIRPHLPLSGTVILTALFASTPMARLLTGSLFVENFWTVMILGAVAALWRFHQTSRVSYVYVFAVLLGTAVSSKFAALGFVILFLPVALWDVARKRVGNAFAIVALIIMFGAHPYIVSQIKTGNPIFPFDTSRSTDARFESPLTLTTLYDLTFLTNRFLELPAGCAGFQYLLLAPLGLIALRRSTSLLAWICLVGAALGSLMVFSFQSNVRYLYVAMPLVTVGFAIALAGYRPANPAFYRTILGVCMTLLVANVYFWGTAGNPHRDFWMDPLDDVGKQKYIEYYAPTRPLIRRLNETAPGRPVAFVATNHIAELRGKAVTDTWHHRLFADRLNNATSPQAVLEIANEYGIEHFVAPSLDSSAILVPAFAPFMAMFTERQLQSGSFYIWKLKPEFTGQAGLERAKAASTASLVEMWRSRAVSNDGAKINSPPGDYDDASGRLIYYGPWDHNNQYPSTSGGTVSYSNVIGASVEFSFTGTEITYLFTRAFNRGKARVRIDETEEVLDQFVRETQWQSTKTWSGLTPGPHKIEISVLPEKNAASQGFYIDVDALLVR